MNECSHYWKKEPFAGSLKCLKCGHVEFNVAEECMSLQERAGKAEARIAELEDQLSKAIVHDDCNYGYGKETER